MTEEKLPHKIPADLKKAINSNLKTKESWESVTPIAKNEFACWIESAKQQETREKRIQRACEDLMNGKRRPCCWPGCIHRKDKPLSDSQKFLISRKKLG